MPSAFMDDMQAGDRMRNRTIRAVAATAVLAMGALVALGGQAPAQQATAATPLLPDLDQDTIRHLVLTEHREGGRRRFRLGFDSAASNVGDGPMLLHGVRTGDRRPTMRADQLVQQSDGSLVLTKGVGALHFIRQRDHQHWHFADFERYELREDRTMELVVRDRKTGFCLGDRYRVPARVRVPRRAPRRVYGDNCGLGRDELHGIFEGISPGWGDRYVAVLEGQYLDITDVPAGTYQLVQRANPDGRLRERTLANNAATNRLRITWPHGHRSFPTVTIVGVCPATFGCVGEWPDGRAPIPPDLRGTPFGDALRPASESQTTTPQQEEQHP